MLTSVAGSNDTNVSESFKAHPWLKNPHLQTLWTRIQGFEPSAPFEREVLSTQDGDELDLDWLTSTSQVQHQKPLLIIFHGLEGSSKSPYADQLAQAALASGIDSVVMHFRGCSGRMNKTATAYHSGAIEDPLHTISVLKQRFPERPLYAAGFSLGANMLVNLLGRVDKPLLDAAVAVCPPLDLGSSSYRMNQGFSRVYRNHLLNSLKQKTLAKLEAGLLEGVLPLKERELLSCRDFPQFDDRVTAPLHGFQGAQDYYTRCSGLQYLPNISVPTLIIHANDDPLMSKQVIPEKSMLSSSTRYELYPHGGHVGFITRRDGKATPWLPSRIMNWFGVQPSSGSHV
ncbi:MAG: putative hydrolase of the alpha/beta-hydrolase fold [Idiomarinaceae bacterium HL-53]|nr:MAG: putative hydrolase of the alpha/beta-hydrolase fold [Idiomarinaceae bacterium HL-53]CUS47532.1 hypothetical protein Ga0003345_0465 [Idiomarinaceae bacterium HL-53]